MLTEAELRWLEDMTIEFLEWSNNSTARTISDKLNQMILVEMGPPEDRPHTTTAEERKKLIDDAREADRLGLQSSASVWVRTLCNAVEDTLPAYIRWPDGAPT